MVAATLTTNTTGITEHSIEPISLYPNPCNDVLNIMAGKVFEQNGSGIEVCNLMGQVIYSGVFTGSLNTALLPKGLYYIKIYNTEARSNSCFIKNE